MTQKNCDNDNDSGEQDNFKTCIGTVKGTRIMLQR